MNTMWLKAFKQNLRDYIWGVVEVIAFFFFFFSKNQQISFIQGTKKNLVYVGSAFWEGKIRISR